MKKSYKKVLYNTDTVKNNTVAEVSIKEVKDIKEDKKQEQVEEKSVFDEDFYNSLKNVENYLTPTKLRTIDKCCGRSYVLTKYTIQYNKVVYQWDELLGHKYEKHHVVVDKDFINVMKIISGKITEDTDEIKASDDIITSITTINNDIKPLYISWKKLDKNNNDENETIQIFNNQKTFASYDKMLEDLPIKDYIVDSYDDLSLLMKDSKYIHKNPYIILESDKIKKDQFYLLYGLIIDKKDFSDIGRIRLHSTGKFSKDLCILTTEELKKQSKVSSAQNSDFIFVNFSYKPIPYFSTTLRLSLSIIAEGYASEKSKKTGEIHNVLYPSLNIPITCLLRQVEYDKYVSTLSADIPIRTNVLQYSDGILNRFSAREEDFRDNIYVYKYKDKFMTQIVDKLKQTVELNDTRKIVKTKELHDKYYDEIEKYLANILKNVFT